MISEAPTSTFLEDFLDKLSNFDLNIVLSTRENCIAINAESAVENRAAAKPTKMIGNKINSDNPPVDWIKVKKLPILSKAKPLAFNNLKEITGTSQINKNKGIYFLKPSNASFLLGDEAILCQNVT